MKVELRGDISSLVSGIGYIAEDLGIELAPGGCVIEVGRAQGNAIELHKDGRQVRLLYDKPVHFFRALALLKENERQGTVHIVQKQQFERCGALFDVSQGNAVLNLQTLQALLRRMALMGLDTVMIYTEDSYEIKTEPWFGYMRGRYSQDELKAIDDYAHALGIEAIPCIQTLAHLHDALRWSRFDEIREDEETLLVGEEKTYQFIEKMIAAASAPFRTRRIHIGMDEAWKLGQGAYLLRNGYKPKYRIMKAHLERVLQITRKYGLSPFIWCDMYFRSVAENLYHSPDIVLPQEVLDSLPKGVTPMGWEYYQFGAENYDKFFLQHKRLSPDAAMAGGIWTWMGYVPEYDMTFLTSNYFLNSAKRVGIRTIMATIWGDCGTESNVYSTLLGLQLFAEHAYSAEEPSRELLRSRFKTCTGCEFDDFYEMTYLDKYDRNLRTEGYQYANPTKALMWQDILLGLFDRNFAELGMDLGAYYAACRARMDAAIGRNGQFDGIFRFMSLFCDVLEIKAEAGIKISRAYRDGSRNVLKRYADLLLPELLTRVKTLHDYHYEQWMSINKPFGWDVLDIRYGGLRARIETTIRRLNEYLDGRTTGIAELEVERLCYNGAPGLGKANSYVDIVSASRL